MTSKLIAAIKLTVPEYMPAGILAAFVGYAFSTGSIQVSLGFIYAVLAVVFVIGGYNTFNAVADRNIDRINKPHRPIPRQLLSTKEAIYITVLLFALALVFGYLVNLTALMLISISIILAALYSMPHIHLKRKLAIGTLVATGLYAVLFPLIGWAVLPTNHIPIILIAFLLLFGLSVAPLKDFEDIVGDDKLGAHTILSTFGHKNTILLMQVLVVLTSLILAGFAFYGLIGVKYLVLLVFNALLLLNLWALSKHSGVKEGKTAFGNGTLITVLMELAILLLVVL
jgi:geranylgeranylglycerol-phosphate geranylgeranyltransferase